jgi:hypothetical protein
MTDFILLLLSFVIFFWLFLPQQKKFSVADEVKVTRKTHGGIPENISSEPLTVEKFLELNATFLALFDSLSRFLVSSEQLESIVHQLMELPSLPADSKEQQKLIFSMLAEKGKQLSHDFFVLEPQYSSIDLAKKIENNEVPLRNPQPNLLKSKTLTKKSKLPTIKGKNLVSFRFPSELMIAVLNIPRSNTRKYQAAFDLFLRGVAIWDPSESLQAYLQRLNDETKIKRLDRLFMVLLEILKDLKYLLLGIKTSKPYSEHSIPLLIQGKYFIDEGMKILYETSDALPRIFSDYIFYYTQETEMVQALINVDNKFVQDSIDERIAALAHHVVRITEEEEPSFYSRVRIKALIYSNAVYLTVTPPNKKTVQLSKFMLRLPANSLDFEEPELLELMNFEEIKDERIISRWKSLKDILPVDLHSLFER